MLEGKVRGVRGVPVFGATVRDVRNVAEFINVNLNQYSGHFQDPMKRSMRCLFEKYVMNPGNQPALSSPCAEGHQHLLNRLS